MGRREPDGRGRQVLNVSLAPILNPFTGEPFVDH
jgi:hypothetical protein